MAGSSTASSTRRSATRSSAGSAEPPSGRLGDAVTVLDQLVFADGFADFLTLEAYRLLD